MKMKSLFMSMLAIATLASCNNDNEGLDNGSVVTGPETGAYLSVAINMPSSALTRVGAQGPGDAGPGSEHGTVDESKVNTVYLLTYKDNVLQEPIRPLTDSEKGTPGANGIPSISGDAIPVKKDINYAIVVINPSNAVLSAMTLNSNKSALLTAMADTVTNLMLPDNGFMMVSDSGFVAVTPVVATAEDANAIKVAKDLAKATPIKMGVDRSVVKTKLATYAGVTTNGTASVEGWRLNTTNTRYYPYAELVTYAMGGVSVTNAKYRQDPNYTALSMDDKGKGEAATQFNWLHNKDYATISWNAVAATEYCLENTMAALGANQNYNNTTKMIIKAKFTPAGIGVSGVSWFRVGGVVMTFKQLEDSYATASDADQVKYNIFLNKVLGASHGKVWKGEEGPVVTLADLDSKSNGGYLAATVDLASNYLIEYFQKSICYYDVNLKHDNRVEAFGLGRWGVVRNNSYTVTINKISQPGLPYVPDPTDPDIVDPSNPNPDTPTPDDEESAFISVSITVNDWATWSQGVDL